MNANTAVQQRSVATKTKQVIAVAALAVAAVVAAVAGVAASTIDHHPTGGYSGGLQW